MAGLRIKYAPIADVRPYEDNPRHNDGPVEAVAAKWELSDREREIVKSMGGER